MICCSEFIRPQAALQAPRKTRELRKEVPHKEQEHRTITENKERHSRAQVALDFGDETRWCDRQTVGSPVSIRRARRHAKGEANAHGRLCRRRLQVRDQRQSRWLSVAGFV